MTPADEKTPLEGDRCLRCLQPLPKNAKRCPNCRTPRPGGPGLAITLGICTILALLVLVLFMVKTMHNEEESQDPTAPKAATEWVH